MIPHKRVRGVLADFPPIWIPLILAPLALFSKIMLAGQALYWGTPFLQFVPWRSWAWKAITEGHLPLWNPWVGMGAPLVANYQSAIFYPPNWLLWFFQILGGVAGHAWGQTVLVVIHLAWAGFGTALLTRRIGYGSLAQCVSGLAFGLSSYLVSRASFLSINAAAAWLPWVIYSADIVRTSFQGGNWPGWRSALRSGLPFLVCLSLQLLAGHAQITWYTIVLAVLWVSAWSIRTGGVKAAGRSLLALGAGGVLAALLAAVQLIPTAEYLLQSQRAASVDFDYAMNFSFWPWRFLTLLAPDLFGNPAQGDYWFNVYFWEDAVYIGLLPFLLTAAAIFNRRKSRDKSSETLPHDRKFLVQFCLAVTFISFLFALGRFTPVFPFFYRFVPTFDMFQAPTRWSVLGVFCLALLAGLGSDEWRRPEKRALYWTRLGTAGAFAVTLGAGTAWLVLGDIRPTFIRATALAGLWGLGAGILSLLAPRSSEEKPAGWWAWSVAAWIALDLCVANWGLNPGISLDLYSKPAGTREQVIQLAKGGRLFIKPQDEEYEKYQRFFQVETFHNGEAEENLRAVLLANGNILDNVASANLYDPLMPARYTRWMSYLSTLSTTELAEWLPWMGVGVLEISDPKASHGVRFEPIEDGTRFRWTDCVQFDLGEEEIWKQVTSRIYEHEPREPGRDRVIMEGAGTTACPDAPPSQADIRIIADEPDGVLLEVNTEREGWLIQADNWYPGWIARIDNQPVPLSKADYLFRAVRVGAGSHRVSIEYHPWSFYSGAAISSILWLIIGFISFRRYLPKDGGLV